MRTGEVIFEAAGCAPDALMESELAFQGVVWQDSTISVSIDGDHMTWQVGDTSLEFTRVDEAPVPSAPPPRTSVGPLDCSPEPLARTRIPAEGTTAGEVAAESDPRVIRVEVVDEFDHQAYGYDAEDEIVVVVQFDDMAPETFSIYTCP